MAGKTGLFAFLMLPPSIYMDGVDCASPDLSKNPVVLFTVLEAARRQNDFATAAAAQRELAAQGIQVKYDGAGALHLSATTKRGSDGR